MRKFASEERSLAVVKELSVEKTLGIFQYVPWSLGSGSYLSILASRLGW